MQLRISALFRKVQVSCRLLRLQTAFTPSVAIACTVEFLQGPSSRWLHPEQDGVMVKQVGVRMQVELGPARRNAEGTPSKTSGESHAHELCMRHILQLFAIAG